MGREKNESQREERVPCACHWLLTFSLATNSPLPPAASSSLIPALERPKRRGTPSRQQPADDDVLFRGCLSQVEKAFGGIHVDHPSRRVDYWTDGWYWERRRNRSGFSLFIARCIAAKAQPAAKRRAEQPGMGQRGTKRPRRWKRSPSARRQKLARGHPQVAYQRGSGLASTFRRRRQRLLDRPAAPGGNVIASMRP